MGCTGSKHGQAGNHCHCRCSWAGRLCCCCTHQRSNFRPAGRIWTASYRSGGKGRFPAGSNWMSNCRPAGRDLSAETLASKWRGRKGYNRGNNFRRRAGTSPGGSFHLQAGNFRRRAGTNRAGTSQGDNFRRRAGNFRCRAGTNRAGTSQENNFRRRAGTSRAGTNRENNFRRRAGTNRGDTKAGVLLNNYWVGILLYSRLEATLW